MEVDRELRDAQDYLIGVFPSTVQTSHDILGRLEMIFLYELPDHHYQIYPERLGEFTAEELRRIEEILAGAPRG